MNQSVLPKIFAATMVLIAAVTLVFAWIWNSKTSGQARIALSLSALEDALLESIAKTQGTSDQLKMTGRTAGRGFDFLLKVNEITTLDRDLKPCTTYPSEECGYKVRYSYDSKRLSYTYEVTSAYAEAPISLGADSKQASGVELIRPLTSQPVTKSVSCDTKTSLAANGYSTLSGLSCLLKPEKQCAAGTLPRGLAVIGAVPRLELICGEASKLARCPPHYALEKIETQSLGLERKTNALCVRTTLANISPPSELAPPPAGRISGRVCPYGYKSDSSCQIVNVVSKRGRCGEGGAEIKPVAGRVEFQQNTSLGFVDCAVRKFQQTCGAKWTAQVQLNIKCVLNQPERVDVL